MNDKDLALRCLAFKVGGCQNTTCKNEACPLWKDKEEVK